MSNGITTMTQGFLDAIAQSGFGQFANEQNLLMLAPEFVILVTLIVGLFQIFSRSEESQREVWRTALLGSLFSFLMMVGLFCISHIDQSTGMLYAHPVNLPVFHMGDTTYAMFRADLFSTLIRLAILLGTFLTILFSRRYLEMRSAIPGEFYVLMLGATLGALLISGANDLIMVFVGLETLGISSFILAGYLRGDLKSTEASLKYLIFGGTSTAVLLFGFSLLYGLAGGHTNFEMIGTALSQLDSTVFNPVVPVMVIMIMAGLAFKISAVPFHMWTPDIYEGAPTPVTAYLSVVSKIGAFALLIRILAVVFGEAPIFQEAGLSGFSMIFAVIAVLSMTLGNVVALRQANIKRMLAYSTIAHVGYILLGLVIMGSAVTPMLFYLLAYLFMNLGAFAVVIHFANITGREDINAYAGLVRKRPFMTLYFSFFLLSLAGIPITAGFFAKFFLFQAVALAGPEFLWLVIIALINSTISLYYYLNVIRLMVVAEPSETVTAMSRKIDIVGVVPVTACVLVCFLGTLLLGIFADPVMSLTHRAVTQLGEEDPYRNVHQMSAAPVRPR